MAKFSWLPSERSGACDPCRNGDHGSCVATADGAVHQVGHPDFAACTCYDHSWEGHETAARSGSPP